MGATRVGRRAAARTEGRRPWGEVGDVQQAVSGPGPRHQPMEGDLGMRMVMFTKLFGTRPVPEMAQTIQELQFDGVDLLIRTGFSVPPDQPELVGKAIKVFRAVGLEVPIATTDLTAPGKYP